jgi:hypothetical protein
MQSIAYIQAPRQDERRPLLAQGGRRVSLNKLSVVMASFAFWATLIGCVALIAH